MTSLTSKKLAALKPQEKRYTVSDGNGLFLRILPTGVKSCVLRVYVNGKIRDITLGRFPDLSLMQARAEARKRKIELGKNPPSGYTLYDAFKLWKQLKRGSIVSYRDECKRIEQYIMQYIGKCQLDQITAPLVIKTVDPIAKDGKMSTLKRIVMRTREILDLAVCAGYIQFNPCARVSRVFKAPKVKPMPSMSWKDLPKILEVVLKASMKIQTLFLFSLATMLRPGEVAKLQWNWISDKVLTIPAEEMKKRRIHRVPLTPYMLHLLEVQKKLNGNRRTKFIFISAFNPSKHIHKQHMAKWLHAQPEFKDRLVAHGLRSIARSWLADQGTSYEVAEACLAHVVGNQVVRSYLRSDYLDARRPVMEAWCAYILTCAEMARIEIKNQEESALKDEKAGH